MHQVLREREKGNKKGEPTFAFSTFRWMVGADGVEPPTYAL